MKRILKHLLWIVPLVLVLAVVSLAAYAAAARRAETRYHSNLSKVLQVSSSSFQHEQEMPVELSCRGAGLAPNIQWTGAPAGTKSYALIAMDWDAPSPSLRLLTVVHWIVYNIPADKTEIQQNSTIGVAGLNMSGQPGYMSPCPPIGVHRYEFRVYALDVEAVQPSSNDRAGLLKAMEGHVLAYGELVGVKSSV